MGEKKRVWILDNFDTDSVTGRAKNEELNDKSLKWLGHWVVGYPYLERHTRLNYTGQIGSIMGMYYSLVFQLAKWEHNVRKADEWVEVSPVHAQYYQLTVKQKEELEGKIKQGLAQVSQAVADSELLMHDKRRYLEFLHYMGYRTAKEWEQTDGKTEEKHNHDDKNSICFEDEDKRKKTVEKHIDNHSLKAVFIDQVDFHTGEGISMRSIVSRWPTLISDFMNLNDDDLSPDKVMEKLTISRAEAVILVTKNKLYQEWKNIFGPEIKNRYMTIEGLLQARKESIDQYREWLKPSIARHRMLKEGLGTAGGRAFNMTTQYISAGQATSAAKICLYVWKDFVPPEIFKGGTEEMGKLLMKDTNKWDNDIAVDDEWTKRTLIFGKEYGLINKYHWITEEWVREKKIEMFRDKWLTPHKPYYTFIPINLEKATIRMPDGNEMDDGIFDIGFMIMSQNAMFCKLLELKAKEEELEHYINKLLGVHKYESGTVPDYSKDKEGGNPALNFFGKFNIKMLLAKTGGPYERDFEDRITKVYLLRGAAERYGPIVGFLKKKMGMAGA